MLRRGLVISIMMLLAVTAGAQTASSLFWRSDSLQVKEIVSDEAVQYRNVGHHGPAVENRAFALRLYFNDSGAIDLYSKSGEQMELLKYLWYPTEKQQAEEGAGCDEYLVGKTVGAGGFALWDGEKEVKLKATKGRTARVGNTANGSFAEIISYGVEYKGMLVDIVVRIDMNKNNRVAKISARELKGRKVQFLTGVNYHKDAILTFGSGYIGAWGIHPADVSKNPTPIGAGIRYNTKVFGNPEKTADMVRIISKPAASVSTEMIAASNKETHINNPAAFAAALKSKL